MKHGGNVAAALLPCCILISAASSGGERPNYHLDSLILWGDWKLGMLAKQRITHRSFARSRNSSIFDRVLL